MTTATNSQADIKPTGRVLVIAGSDPSGGAGIQADIKSITANGAYAMTAITALTVQNTQGVYDILPIPIGTVTAQISACLSDIGADAIKTGMLGSKALIESTAQTLHDTSPSIPRIVDPVMVATSGDRLLAEDAVGAVLSVMVPGAALLTPNAPEAEILANTPVETVDGQRKAADRLLEKGAKAVLVKGGHVSGDQIVDVLHTEYDEILFEYERIETSSTHGTGCTLASAIAAHVSLGRTLPDAVDAAGQYLHKAIETAPGFGKGRGPVNHGWSLRQRDS